MSANTDFCSRCGTALQPNSVFCPNCGQRVSAPEPAYPATQKMPEPPVFDAPGRQAAPAVSYEGDVYDAPAPKRRNPLLMIAGVLVGLCLCGFVTIAGLTALMGGSIASLAMLAGTSTATATLTPVATNTPLPPTVTPTLPPGPAPTDASLPQTGETPEVVPTPENGIAASSDNPFSDDFSTERGWAFVGPDEHPDYAVSRQNQYYSMHVKVPSKRAWVFPPLTYTPTNIEFDATIPTNYAYDGKNAGTFGAACFYTDNQNFHQIELDPNNKAVSIARYRNGERTPLTADSWVTFSNFANGAGANNHVMVECRGNTLSVYVNNELALSVDDPTLAVTDSTRMGISVTTYDAIDPGGYEMWFDNFSAWAARQ